MPIRTPVNTDLRPSYGLAPSTLEDIDSALYNHINDIFNIYVNTNKGFEKVPIVFSIPERAFQIKKDPTLRTENGRTLVYPLISILRSSMTVNPDNKSRFGVEVPPYFDYYKKGGSIEIARQIKQDKTQDFANANSIRRSSTKTDINFQTSPGENEDIIYESLLVPMPTYVEMGYSIGLVTEYQQQMNELVAPFMTKPGVPSVFRVEHEGNKYECFVEADFSTENNSSGLDVTERIFKTTITMKVLGYIIGADKNQSTPIIVRRQSATKIRFQRERVILGDEIESHIGLKEKYRP
tara:strand:- start:680 stop:1564 length:885 start_codon:yes stop_codon:yes gene_type:complete